MTNFDWKGKVIIVTGASSGVGRATALNFAKKGANVVIAARSKDRLKEAEGEILRLNSHGDVLIIQTDVTKKEQVDAMVKTTYEKFGKIDVLVNNAGVVIISAVDKAKPSDIDSMMKVNFFAMLYGVQAVLPIMARQRYGSIVNVASTAGKRGNPETAGYTATKSAVIGFTDVLRQEVANLGIHVALICPGLIDTPMGEYILENMPCRKKVKIKALTPKEVAETIMHSVEAKKREIIIPWAAKLYLKVHCIFPDFLDSLYKKIKP